MTTCTFAGHRQTRALGAAQKLYAVLEDLLATDTAFLFYTGGSGEFDELCATAVRRARHEHPELHIRLYLVLPYMMKSLNDNRAYYESAFDGLFVPAELMGVHYKSAIKQRNRWMVDRADVLIACVFRPFGSAYETLQYAKARPGMRIVNLAEE